MQSETLTIHTALSGSVKPSYSVTESNFAEHGFFNVPAEKHQLYLKSISKQEMRNYEAAKQTERRNVRAQSCREVVQAVARSTATGFVPFLRWQWKLKFSVFYAESG